jgi:hypothetical protein
MKHIIGSFLITLVLLACTVGPTCVYGKVQVGEEVTEKYETLHPYGAAEGLAWEQEFYWPEASYIAIHFSKFHLSAGDFVEISDPRGKFRYVFEGKGKKVIAKKGKYKYLDTFWATHIPGERAYVRLYNKRDGKKNEKKKFGFVIDKWARGYEPGYIAELMGDPGGREGICNFDDKKWAKCYDATTMYEKSKTVARLLINGTSACTGWLLGSEGHVITNNHCIGNAADANNTDYEFMAEGAVCSTDCTGWFNCPGIVEASSGALIKNDFDLDYSLILLPSNVTASYGYLQFRETLPVVGERIYMPQHPAAGGKQLAVESDVDGPFAKIYSTDETPCIGGPGDIGYFADTEGGSSGSPVIAFDDHLVVALHHCSYCPNRGVPIPDIIAHLGSDIPANAIGGVPLPDYCASGSYYFTWEWIAGVKVGNLDNNSGAANYSDFTSMTAELAPGVTAHVKLTPGYSGYPYYEYWRIWIDYNGDHDFTDMGEMVFQGYGNSVVKGSFEVPQSASGLTRMRVTMSYGGWASPCGPFTFGEVEDYTVFIKNYCDSSGIAQYYEWIARVQVSHMDNSSGPSGYSDFTHITADLMPGRTFYLHLTPGFSSIAYTEYWRIWIDYNHDGDFDDPGEQVFQKYHTQPVTGSFTVPADALTGKTRMRVSMRYGSYPVPCGLFNWGEVEDYTVEIR